MSKYNQGILGPFSGKVGPVVGSYWKGRYVMRVRPAHVTNPQTTDQMTVRQRLSVLSKTFACMRDALALGFKVIAKNLAISPINAAIKNNADAVIGTYPSVELVLENMLVADGTAYNVVDATAAQGSGSSENTLNVSWTNNAGVSPSVLDGDSVVIMVYNPTKNESVTDISATRVDQAAVVNIPSSWVTSQDRVFMYIFTMDANREDKISKSEMLGDVVLQSAE